MLLSTRALRRPPVPSETTVEIDGRPVRVAIRETAQARRYSLRLPSGGSDPVLTLPKHSRLQDALDFLQRHRLWLADRLARRPANVAFAAGSRVMLRGTELEIRHSGSSRGTTRIESGPDGHALIVSGAPEHLPRRVQDFLKKEARRDLEAAVALHAGRLEVKPTALRLKDTRSRWGSCTASGELSFSWRVIMAPPFVLDYLAAHEVAHLRELNHSHRFWRLVRQTCPDMERGQAWLKREGAKLHAFGR